MTRLTRRTVLAGITGLTATTLIGAPAGFAASAFVQFRPNGSASVSHSAYDDLLKVHVKRDAKGYHRVDYRGVKANRAALKAYLVALQEVRPSTLTRAEAHAYWINLYNAATLDVVVEHYPVKSIKKINLGGGGLFGSGPWSKPLLTVEGMPLSLDDIEHRIVRPIFVDPLSHYGLNCASYSCPNLAVSAFTGSNVNTLLTQNARDYVNHERGVSVQSGRITSSKIYSWYAQDFGGKRRLKTHWSQYGEPELVAAIKPASLGRFTYDWSLNDVR